MSLVNNSATTKRRPAAIYLFVVTFLATVVIGLFGYPFPQPSYEVTKRFTRPRLKSDSVGGIAEDSKQLLNEEYKVRVVDMRLLTTKQLESDVRVHGKELEPFQVSYLVSVRQVGRENAVRLAKLFVEDFVAWNNRNSNSTVDPAAHKPFETGKVATAKLRERQSRKMLIGFVESKVPQWLDRHTRSIVAQVHQSTPQLQPEKPRRQKVNPRWTRAQQRIDKMTESLEELQQTRTDQHPEYRFALMKLNELKRRQSKLPRYDGVNQAQADARSKARPRSQADPRQGNIARQAKESRDKLHEQLGQLVNRYKQAVHVRDREQEEFFGAALGSGRGWSIKSDNDIRRLPTDVNTRFLLTLLGVAVTIGAVFGIAATRLGQPTFQQTGDVQAVIAAPIVGVLPSATPVGRRSEESRAAILKGVQRGAEGLLLISAICFLVVCLSASQRLTDFSYDPIGVLVETVRWSR